MDPQGSISLAINITMIKVGVFGDSFAKHGDVDAIWPTLMGKLDKNITFVNHGYPGSSLWHTYEQLRDHADQYTHLVIMVTQWGRYKLPGIEEPGCHVAGISNLEARLKENNADTLRTSYQSLMNWLIHCSNDEQEKLYHQLLVDHIHNTYVRSHRMLMVPCFGPMDSGHIPGWRSGTMMDISCKDMETPGWFDNILMDDPRPCHMNRENNGMFAHKVLGWVHGAKFVLDSKDYVPGKSWELLIK